MDEINRKCCIYEAIKNMFDFHWDNTRDIERKATSLIGFVGIIFTIGTVIFSNVEQISHFGIISLGLGFFLLFVTIVASATVLKVRLWHSGYDIKEFMVKSNQSMITEEILDYLIKEYIESCNENNKMNYHISKYLKISYYTFIFGMLSFGIYITLQLFSNW
ncbi:hypothetical protein MettiDRAFT_1288 [Methanolobus tindarius DSM 2278]|uniref:Uncharacterized protein n=1 Tax=Methanolobus tindarius DSM 2278 TaxID=1090322 RepID=W9DVZ2_METTI|nr:hypothetical protein [Methanolobus tindarius]ETA67852.1 hypothetical protein MettiDRAFT_1288 [Methanolobus tindarius DSM 2278]